MTPAQRDHSRIDLLGRFRISVDGEPAPDAVSSRGRELLALLLLQGGEAISRERVASRMWPESTEAQARTNLRRELHQLRRVLPNCERMIATSGKSLALRVDDGLSSDLCEVRSALGRARFARDDARREGSDEVSLLTEAANGYAGELLPECFAEWLVPEREHLKAEVVVGLRRLVELLEERRELLEAARWARRLTEIEPLDEIAYRAQMRLYAAASDRASALHAFHRCARLLERELGIEPAPETRELYRTLVGYAPPVREDEPSAVEISTHSAPETRALVGRSEDLDRLLAAWKRTDTTGPRVACIVGEPGIGKSRLAEEIARQIERAGANVARARAYAVEGQLSYGPVVDWLRSPRMLGRLRDLDPVWRAELARLLPEALGSAAPEAEAAAPAGEDSLPRRRLFEAVARLLRSGPGPALLLLDDLQWCDKETLALLHYVARYEAGSPLLLLATARSHELADNEAAQRLLLTLRQEGRLLEVELGPLGISELGALLRAAAGDEHEAITDAATERLYRLSEGNPLFALEALRASLHLRPAAGELIAHSPRVRAVLTARLEQLGPRARELAECAATIGRAFTFDVLREAADLDERELVPALDELWRRRIVREHPTLGYDFSHDALREAAMQGVSAARARLLHRRVAQALELVRSPNLDEIAASLASHYELAGLPERATGYYRRAARASAAVYAHDRAVALLNRGLELVSRRPPSRERDREELALLLQQTPSLRAVHGYTAGALLHVLERAGDLADRVEDAPALFQVFRNLWALRFVGGDLSGTLEIAARLRGLAALLPELEAESHHAMGGALTHVGEFETAIRHFEAARNAYDPHDARRQLSVFGSDLGVFNSAWEAHALWLYGLEDRGVAAANEAVQMARSLEHAYSEALAQAYAAVLHYMRGDRRACADAADAARDLCERHGFAYYGHWGALLGAWARADTDPAAAIVRMRDALAALDAEGASARRPLYLAAFSEVLMAAGHREEALAALDEAEVRAASSGDQLWSAELARLRALQQADTAEHHARRALNRAQRLRARPLAVRSAVTLAAALRGVLDSADATDLLRATLAALPDGGSSLDRERALRLLSSLD